VGNIVVHASEKDATEPVLFLQSSTVVQESECSSI